MTIFIIALAGTALTLMLFGGIIGYAIGRHEVSKRLSTGRYLYLCRMGK